MLDEWKSVEGCSEMFIDVPSQTSIDVQMSDRQIFFVDEKEEFRSSLEESFRRTVDGDICVHIILLLVNGEMDLFKKSVLIVFVE